MTDCRPPSIHEESFAALWHDQRGAMVRLAALLLDGPEAAEDVVQDAYLAMIDRWHDVCDPAAYLRTSVVNGCRSRLRRRSLARRRIAAWLERPASPAEDSVLIGDEHRQVLAAIRTLSARTREVVVLKYWHRLSDDDIAATLRISPSNVRAVASRGRRQIAAELEETQ